MITKGKHPAMSERWSVAHRKPRNKADIKATLRDGSLPFYLPHLRKHFLAGVFSSRKHRKQI